MGELLERAIAIARDAHEGQTDKANRPYFLHPEAVAGFVGGIPSPLSKQHRRLDSL